MSPAIDLSRVDRQMNYLALGALFIVAPILALAQAVPAVDSSIGPMERTGLIGVLLVSVGYLVRARDGDRVRFDTQIAAKDAALLASSEHVTAALVAQTTSNQELRKIIEKSEETQAALLLSISRLGESVSHMPCRMNDERPN